MKERYHFCIEYDAPLDNGLLSCRGGHARQLQSWGLCLGERGHLVDIYTTHPESIKYDYPNVRFLDIDSPLPEIQYDVVFFNGWSRDSCRYKGDLYLYLEWSKNWEICRPNQVEFLKNNNVKICYPFRIHRDTFIKDSIFKDKTYFLPFPNYNPEQSWPKVRAKNNYRAKGWSISCRHGMPEGSDYIDNLKSEIATRSNDFDVSMVSFPENQPYQSVWDIMPSLQLLFPLCDSASSVEAILSGTVPLPVFMSQNTNPAGQVLRYPATKAGILMERPPNSKNLFDCVSDVLSSERRYLEVLDYFRDYLEEHSFENAYRTLIDLIKE